MPLFPVSVPSLPSFPSFPSVSSMRALLDPEPQLFYPAPKSPGPRRRRDSSSSTRSNASGIGGSSGGCSGGVSSGSPIRRPPPNLGGLGRLHGASRSAVDLGMWGNVDNPLAELGRRNSTSSRPFHIASDGLATPPSRLSGDSDRCPVVINTSPSPSPQRTHRRSQSALPTPGYSRPFPQVPAPAPRGRLTEFSRNPLASSSAVSLPTLAEGEMEHLHSPSTDPTPVHTRLYRRPSTRTTITIPTSSPTSPKTIASPVGSLNSPLSLSFSLDSSHSSSSAYSDYFGPQPPIPEFEDPEETPRPAGKRRNSVGPLVLSVTPSSSVPPPQRVAKLRPPMSPRSSSEQVVSRRTHHRTQSHAPGLTIPLSRSVSIVSDVAVMATWAFPESPERRTGSVSGGTESVGKAATEPGGRLRARLRTLSMLDTSPALGSEAIDPSPPSEAGSSTAEANRQLFQFPAGPAQTRQSPHLSHLQRGRAQSQHRYTHSSPTSLPPPRAAPSFPPHPSHAFQSGLLFAEAQPNLTSGPGSHISSRNPSPARPGHRRTTTPSRLRSPQLLSLPSHSSLGGLSSSDHVRSRGRSSPTGSVASLPPLAPHQHPLARTRSAVDRVPSLGGDGEQKSRGWWRMRRYSVCGEISPLPKQNVDNEGGEGEGLRVGVDDEAKGCEGRRESSPEDERFIDFDDI